MSRTVALFSLPCLAIATAMTELAIAIGSPSSLGQ